MIAAGSVAALATLFFPPSSQATLRRDAERPALAWVADRESAGIRRAAVLYALLAILIWPAVRNDRGDARPASVADGSPLGRWARLAWFVLCGAMAALMLLAPALPATLTARGGTQAAIVTIGLAAAFALAAVGVFAPAAMRPALLVAVIAALVIWTAGENFGGLVSGSATDPNSGPLLVLIALAFWPAGAGLARAAGPRWLAIRPNRSQ